MALRFRELPWYFQTLLFFAVAVGIFVGGELIDLPPVLPLVSAKNEQADLERQYKQLVDDVAKLQAVKQRHQELRTRLGATRDQLVQIQTVVPREKQTDEFMRLLQGSAVNAQVSLRRFTARPVVFKESYAEIPFEIDWTALTTRPWSFSTAWAAVPASSMPPGCACRGLKQARAASGSTPRGPQWRGFAR
ncbi:MAG: type 4a pilus biogenesis protein PilO [Acidobacteria bacterium]|nr:type 4a pilus biogenesis protein PilO [Acidobacteriota bacterium]